MKFKDFIVVWNFLWCNQFSQALYNENDHVYIDKLFVLEFKPTQVALFTLWEFNALKTTREKYYRQAGAELGHTLNLMNLASLSVFFFISNDDSCRIWWQRGQHDMTTWTKMAISKVGYQTLILKAWIFLSADQVGNM